MQASQGYTQQQQAKNRPLRNTSTDCHCLGSEQFENHSLTVISDIRYEPHKRCSMYSKRVVQPLKHNVKVNGVKCCTQIQYISKSVH